MAREHVTLNTTIGTSLGMRLYNPLMFLRIKELRYCQLIGLSFIDQCVHTLTFSLSLQL